MRIVETLGLICHVLSSKQGPLSRPQTNDSNKHFLVEQVRDKGEVIFPCKEIIFTC